MSTDLAIKEPCRVATTANVSPVSGLITIDGVGLAAGDRVLVKSQTNAVQNGIWVASASSWTRATDFDGAGEVTGGTQVLVTAGNMGAGLAWRVTGSDPVSPGSDPVQFEPAVSSGAVTIQVPASGAVARLVDAKLREVDISVFDFMTAAEIASVQAYSYSTDVTSPFQAAIDYAYRNAMRLRVPWGGYLVSQINLPDNPAIEFRGYPFELYGDGRGEAFVMADSLKRGTVIRGNDPSLPTLKVSQEQSAYGTGVLHIHGFRFEGDQDAGVPVADIEALYGSSKMEACDFYQAGAGDGCWIGFMATGTVEHCYFINRDWNEGRGISRVGTGFRLRQDISCGLATIRKCTSRGWATGYDFGDEDPESTVITFSLLVEACESSVVGTGMHLRKRLWKATLDANYFEGVEGTCVLNEGNYTTISNCDFGKDFAIGIDDSSDENIGTLIEGNDLQVADVTPCTLIKVTSSATFGGPNKNIVSNTLTWSYSGVGSIPNIIGIEIAGIEPRLTIMGNAFSPRGTWMGGTNSAAIVDNSSDGGLFGFAVAKSGHQEFPLLSRGAISFGISPSLTENAVSGGSLPLQPGSWFEMNAGSAIVVNAIDGGDLDGRIVVIETITAHCTFASSAVLILAGAASFTGPGTLTLLLKRIGSITYARELARSVF